MSTSDEPGLAREATVVVIGLGYVGLPLVAEAVNAGMRVRGYDHDQARVDALNAGRSPIEDLSNGDLRSLLAQGFYATADPAVLAHAHVALICVPTPLGGDGRPDLSAVLSAAHAVADGLHPGMLVVLESTSYPGTTDEILRPLLEDSGLLAGQDFYLAYSPERIDPGNPRFGLRNTPKVVGGHTPACTAAAVNFYARLVNHVVAAKGTREAEMAKLLENTYRHVNIALVNEMAVFCDELGIDLWDAVAAAATKPFGFEAFYPGPGVGGHCIPIDPNYLSYTVRRLGYPFRFVELAQEINGRMPAYVVARVQRLLNADRKAVKGSTVLLLGVAYKANIGDVRESPAQPVATRLRELGADVTYHDPRVPVWDIGGQKLESVANLSEAVRRADVTVLLQAHSEYDLAELASTCRALLDTRGVVLGERVERL